MCAAAPYEKGVKITKAEMKRLDIRGDAFHPDPSRRPYIPKPDGQQRPFAVAALEDKIVVTKIAEVPWHFCATKESRAAIQTAAER
jgi:hypothetical protein